MRLISIISTMILVSGCIFTHNVDTRRIELPEIQGNDYLIDYKGYTVSYNMLTKTPEWVAYVLTAEETYGEALREGKFFRKDERIPLPQADDSDYRGSGWTRGHLAPAADFRWDDEAMWETFYFTNCCPQDEELNNGIWNTLEKKCRKWARDNHYIYIVSGPIYGSNRYGTIGNSHVRVPDSFFKAILMINHSGHHAIGFIMENSPNNGSLQSCAMSIDELEEITGLDFFPALEDGFEITVEEKYSFKPWKL